ncbi:alpha/beta hydrolase [Dyadobacter sp. LHD-138]|uniref:alpha/beta fold hydrolase n=1 Tax=Dyadobacter sp. LHD-138 TaxID=3071413 RepID=UPI0027E19CEC|nr:alpha/beta hydrolase [Dyadobacter sp. LHD-138]MDQ6478979.1 alpha/beta hydrolase [Dyadobacter sp. LHD-138]
MTGTITDYFISIDGKQIHFVEKPGDLPTIVMIHGRCLSTRMWERQFNSNQLKRHHLIAIDLPGHGLSDHSQNPLVDYSLFGYRDLLLEILSIKKLDRYLLVGHSFGGYIVLETLPYLTGCLGMLIMTNPLVKPIQFELMFKTESLGVINEVYQKDPDRKTLEKYSLLLLHPRQHEIPSFIVEDFARTDPNVHDAILQGMFHSGYKDEIKLINDSKFPVLVVYGDRDQITSSTYLESLTLANWHGSISVIENSGHLMPWEKADVFNELLTSMV